MSGTSLSEADARRLRECLSDGGVAVFPTDTVYGLACDPECRAAVERLYELKGRPSKRPAAVMFFALAPLLEALPGLEMQERAALTALLPGPATLLLPNRERRFPLACVSDVSTIGLRVPSLGTDLGALRGVCAPVLQSSANISGEQAARRVEDLPTRLRERVDLVLDVGELPGTASTVVDLRAFQRTGAWSIVRRGALANDAVARALA